MNKLISPILFIMCLFLKACSNDNSETRDKDDNRKVHISRFILRL